MAAICKEVRQKHRFLGAFVRDIFFVLYRWLYRTKKISFSTVKPAPTGAYQSQAQRSGLRLERRSDEANEQWRKKRRRERYEVRDDVAIQDKKDITDSY